MPNTTMQHEKAMLFCCQDWNTVDLSAVLDDVAHNSVREIPTASHYDDGVRSFECLLCLDGIGHTQEPQ